jgi:hypothetical protein
MSDPSERTPRPEAARAGAPGRDRYIEIILEEPVLSVAVSDPAWWLDHMDELLDGLRRAVLPRDGFGRPVVTWPLPGHVMISHPRWWVDFPDELEEALREAVRVDRAG